MLVETEFLNRLFLFLRKGYNDRSPASSLFCCLLAFFLFIFFFNEECCQLLSCDTAFSVGWGECVGSSGGSVVGGMCGSWQPHSRWRGKWAYRGGQALRRRILLGCGLCFGSVVCWWMLSMSDGFHTRLMDWALQFGKEQYSFFFFLDGCMANACVLDNKLWFPWGSSFCFLKVLLRVSYLLWITPQSSYCKTISAVDARINTLYLAVKSEEGTVWDKKKNIFFPFWIK